MPKHELEGSEEGSEALERQLALLRDLPVHLPPATTQQVMARVRATPEGTLERLARWWLQPATLRAPRLALTGVAALLMVVAGIAGSRLGQSLTGSKGVTHAPATRFVFIAPGARSISVTGDFRGWDPAGIPLSDVQGAGVWTIDIPLAPGMHRYQFIVNGGEWVADPNALLWEDDGFGRRNSIIVVPAATRS